MGLQRCAVGAGSKTVARLVVLLALIAPAAGCSWTVEPRLSAQLNAPVDLRYGWTAVWPQTDLTLHFQAVTGDDRCPRQVICEWVGEARIQAGVQAGDFPPRRFEMSTYAPFGEDQIVYAGYSIRLIEVSPYPEQPNEQRAPEDYRLTLLVSPAPSEALSVALDTPFALQTGQTAALAGEELALTWESVVDDSRCPAMVSCVWSGEARLAVQWLYQGAAGSAEMTTLPNGVGNARHELAIGPYRVRLLGVTPEPDFPDQPIQRAEYATRWVFERP